MATCPECGSSSRVDPDAITVERVLAAKPLGTFSLGGSMMKVSARDMFRMSCRCGWFVHGRVEGEDFVAETVVVEMTDEP